MYPLKLIILHTSEIKLYRKLSTYDTWRPKTATNVEFCGSILPY